ncbi:MAG TPA: Lrp/AsnC family transcriptional regulator [Chloroflexi bacterium]|nr:Lrp/AsnC family transcriptional regulator [Chloroflexota bacterium]
MAYEGFDELDHRIIQQLRKDARMSSTKIARMVGANERTVRNRIDRMIASGAIRLTAVVEPKAFGYTISVDIFLEIAPELEQDIIARLLAMNEVSYLAYGTSTNEISIEMRLRDTEQVGHVLRAILPSIPGVRVKGYALVPGILRNIDEWMPPPSAFSG